MKHTIWLLGSDAVCPECAGMMRQIAETAWKCVDCGSLFRVVEEGAVDREIVCEKVEKITAA